MKKIVLSLAGVMAAIAFAPEASALPVFARQTGMACSACHFQHFPLLNGFGRAFKAAGFTMMGAQGKVETAEGEHGSTLSIPNTLNLGVLTTTRYDRIGNSPVGIAGNSSGWAVPAAGGEFSMFIGGRIAEFAGFLAELGLNGATAGTGAAKLALLFPVGDARVGLVAITTGGQGIAHSFELLNTGAANTHKVAAFNGSKSGGSTGTAGNHVAVTSAAQYLGTNTAATGVSLVANNSMGYIVVGKYEQAGVGTVGAGNGQSAAGSLPLSYVRLAGTFDVAGWDAAVGFQNWGGRTTAAALAVNGTNRATVIDGQMQGELAGMPAGFYASYGTASAGSQFAGGALTTSAAKSFNITGELGVIPHTATVQLALRSATNGAGQADSGIMIGGTYELAQNIELSLTHTSNSGAAWTAVANRFGKTETTLMLEALF